MSKNPGVTPQGGLLFDRMAERSPLTGYEPNSLIEVSSEHTPINFLSRKNSFNTDLNDLATTVAASETNDTIGVGQLTSPLVPQEREVSANPFGVFGSQQQAAQIYGVRGNPCEVLSHFQMSKGHCRKVNEIENWRECNFFNRKRRKFCLNGEAFMNTLIGS